MLLKRVFPKVKWANSNKGADLLCKFFKCSNAEIFIMQICHYAELQISDVDEVSFYSGETAEGKGVSSVVCTRK